MGLVVPDTAGEECLRSLSPGSVSVLLLLCMAPPKEFSKIDSSPSSETLL
jgi:hypothetical protein